MLSDSELGRVLTEMGDAVDWPEPSTGFARRVVARVGVEPPPRAPWVRRFAPAFGVLAVLTMASLVVSPAARDAVADFIGLGGVRIGFGDPRTTPTPPPVGSGLGLGSRVTLEAASAGVDFDPRVPSLAALGAPDDVYLHKGIGGGMASLVYGPRPGYPTAENADVSILVTQFSAPLADDPLVSKKLLGSGTIVERVEVNSSEGYWLSGDTHFIYYFEGPDIDAESVRLVENVLLWEEDGITFRIETRGSLRDALEVAASLR